MLVSTLVGATGKITLQMNATEGARVTSPNPWQAGREATNWHWILRLSAVHSQALHFLQGSRESQLASVVLCTR